MHCRTVKIGEHFAIICGPRHTPALCQFCRKRPHTKLCDAPRTNGYGPGGSAATCEGKMCNECATAIGTDTDYCPIHAGKKPIQPAQKALW
jgi:hypothetical protein